MNLEQVKNNNKDMPLMDDLDFDFKPITSGLGFHHQKTTEVKPVTVERKAAPTQFQSFEEKKETAVYQNDLSIFYGPQGTQELKADTPKKVKEEKIIRMASRPERISAYLFDLFFIVSLLGIVLTVMARTISMDIVDVWSSYPAEITPLVLTLFCGFYIMYFSIFEKTGQSTVGKFIFKLRVTTLDNKTPSLTTLILRTVVSLLNFASLGLFSYFDLQDKVTASKVVNA